MRDASRPIHRVVQVDFLFLALGLPQALQQVHQMVGQRPALRLAFQHLMNPVLEGVVEQKMNVVALRGRPWPVAPDSGRRPVRPAAPARTRTADRCILVSAWLWAVSPRPCRSIHGCAFSARFRSHWPTPRKRWLVAGPAKRRKPGKSCSGRNPFWYSRSSRRSRAAPGPARRRARQVRPRQPHRPHRQQSLVRLQEAPLHQAVRGSPEAVIRGDPTTRGRRPGRAGPQPTAPTGPARGPVRRP